MKKEEQFEKIITSWFIKFIAYFLKWSFLIIAAITTSITLVLIIIAIIKNSSMSIDILEQIVPLLTYYKDFEIVTLIDNIGMSNIVIGSIGNGLATSITYILLYSITRNFIKLFELINSSKIFSDESVDLINKTIPLSVLVTFAQPSLMLVTIYSTRLFIYEDINISGLAILLAVYILKIIFTSGNELAKKNEESSRELSLAKAKENDLKMARIKEESTKDAPKAPKKKTTKETKKATKK